MKAINESHGPRWLAKKDSSRWRVELQLPCSRVGLRCARLRFGLLCGLLACFVSGCSRTPNAAEIQQITALGGRVAIDPFDKSVVKVWLSGTDADDKDMQIVARLPKLRELHLGGTQVSDEGIKQIASLSKLQTLDIVDTTISDAGVASLTNLTALIRLAIAKTKITDAALNSLTSLPHLQELGVEGTAVTDAATPTLAKITRLRALSLDDTKLTDTGLERLRGLRALTSLGLAGTLVDDRAVKTIAEFRALSNIRLLRSRVSDQGMAAIRKAFPKAKMDWKPPKPKPAQPAKAVAVHGVIRIKAGSASPFTDSSGNVWQAELGFAGGKASHSNPNNPITNTKDADLYRSAHFGMASFSCEVPNGKYIAKLHFAETFRGIRGEGKRVFSFNVQGHEFKDFDIWKKAGGPNRAYVEMVPVEVTNGKFKITFTKKIEMPQINAIELAPQNGSAPAAAPTASSASPPAAAVPARDSAGGANKGGKPSAAASVPQTGNRN
jgi:hypothetical protein